MRVGAKLKSDLSALLEKMRIERGWRQHDLDEIAGLPKGTVSQLESGNKLFSEKRVKALAHAFGVGEDVFWGVVHAQPSKERVLVNEELATMTDTQLLNLVILIRTWRADGKL